MFQNNETDPVKVTATVVLSMAWSILVVVTLGVFLFLTSDGKPSYSGYNVCWQISMSMDLDLLVLVSETLKTPPRLQHRWLHVPA